MRNTNNKNKINIYFEELDVLKAIGIFLVVVGHAFPDASLPEGIENSVCNLIFNLIYSFHMPLFIVAAGILANYCLKHNKIVSIIKRAKRLLIPYFVWGIIYIPFRVILAGYSSAIFNWNELWRIVIGHNPYSGLWFLYALFFIGVLQILLIDNTKKLYISLICSFILLLIGKSINIIEPVNWLFLYSFYYLLGIWIKQNYQKVIWILNRKSILFSTGFLFVLLFYINSYMNNLIGIVSITLALSGSAFVFSLSIFLKNNSLLVYIGKFSMDIYILSGPILVALRIVIYRILGVPYILYTIISVIIAFVLPILLSKFIIRRSNILSYFLLGIEKKENKG